MFSFLFPSTIIQKADFEDVKYAIQNPSKIFLINTMSSLEQDILIQKSVHSQDEEKVVNELLSSFNIEISNVTIIIYGKNANDASIETKYHQMKKLGFQHVYIYYGGMFEWALLNELYGTEEFPTTQKIRDILKFKSSNSAIAYKYKMLKY
jgi:hypothetical protein